MHPSAGRLHVRWLGRVPYREALAVQESLFRNGTENHLLLLEHRHVFTHGPRADLSVNVLVDPSEVGAELVGVNRGGDVTYHGPGQLVGYPILSLPPKHAGAAGPADTVAHVCSVEQLVIDALGEMGLPNAGRLADFPGVWLDPDGPNPRKICAIGVRVSRGRTMHGFALNVATDMRYLRDYIVPCGIADRPVTSLVEEGVDIAMADVVEIVARLAGQRWGGLERQDVAWQHRAEDLSAFSRGAGPGTVVRSGGVTTSLSITDRKPAWLRPKVHHGPGVLAVKKTMRDLALVTVCEEAGCPNLSECWSDGTATFMVLGERCTRACGFCLVDTHKPDAPDPDEPARVAEAVVRMDLTHAVLTMVARDDLPDGGMAHVAACVNAIRLARPSTRIETLISDAKGDHASLALLFASSPDVLNHNVETVPRLQRSVRPSAGYARSLSVLANAVLAKRGIAGMSVKSGLIVGMGERVEEVDGVLADLASLGVDIVTIGQYLRPTSNHLPVQRWVEPAEFERWKVVGEALGIGHVEAGPLTRSSYHARQSADSVSIRVG